MTRTRVQLLAMVAKICLWSCFLGLLSPIEKVLASAGVLYLWLELIVWTVDPCQLAVVNDCTGTLVEKDIWCATHSSIMDITYTYCLASHDRWLHELDNMITWSIGTMRHTYHTYKRLRQKLLVFRQVLSGICDGWMRRWTA